jgi:hypothetical protein
MSSAAEGLAPCALNCQTTPLRLLQAPGYSQVIKQPMDFGTIHDKVEAGEYPSWEALETDLELMFNNAITFNGPEHSVSDIARSLLRLAKAMLELAKCGITNFRGRIAAVARQVNKTIRMNEVRGRALCGGRVRARACGSGLQCGGAARGLNCQVSLKARAR